MKQRTGRKLFGILITLALAIGLMLALGATAYAVPAHVHDDGVIFNIPWNDSTRLPTDPGNYYLTTDVTLSEYWLVQTGTTNLCLNGHGIIQTGKARVIHLANGRTLNLCDCGTAVHNYTVSNGLATVNDDATGVGVKTFTGGYITGADVSVQGGGVFIDGGTLHMSGGTIIGNRASDGGGVCVVGSGTFDITGGVITGNTCSAWGGGVIVFNGNTFNVSGTPVIDGNYKGSYVSNVHLNESPGNAGIITIAAPGLKPGAKIGVYQYSADKFPFTSGFKTYHENDNPLTYFSSDQGRAIIVRQDELWTTDTQGIPASISYDITKVQKKPGDGPFINPLNNTGNGTVTYAVTPGTGVAQVDSSTGEVTIIGTGEAIITATVADPKAYNYDPETAFYTLSVHNHSFTYTASGATITATCEAQGCPLPVDVDSGKPTASLIINKPELTFFGGTESAAATLTGSIPDLTPTIVYKEGNTTLNAAPTRAGAYTASVTVGVGTGAVTASVDYAITLLSVGGTQVTSTNAANVFGDGKVSFTLATETTPATLTLNNYTCSGEGYDNGIYYIGSSPLNIILVGNNSIAGSNTSSGTACGLYAESNVHITGTGSLTAKVRAKNQGYGINVAKGGAVLTIDEGATVLADATDVGSNGYGMWIGSGWNPGRLVIGNDITSVISIGTNSAFSDNSKVINSIIGNGWTNTEGTAGEAVIAVSADGQILNAYKKAKFPGHAHNFTYTASGATITATCTADGCPLPESSAGAGDHVATLTIAAPASPTYDGTTAYAATITDADGIQGEAKVQYQKKTGESAYDAETETAPVDAGDYKASITLGDGEGAKTAYVEYTIAKAAGAAATAPTSAQITKTDTSVTVKPTVEGQEYAIVAKTDPATQPDWTNAKPHDADNGVTFTGLNPNTEYEVYTRVKEMDNTLAGTPVTVDAKTDPKHLSVVTLSPTENITDGVTLTANLDPADAGGTIAYKWSYSDTADGTFTEITGATNSTYTIDPAYVGKYIKVVATQTATDMTDIQQYAVTSSAVEGREHTGNEVAVVTGGSATLSPEQQKTADTVTVTTSPVVGWQTTGVQVKEKGGDGTVTATPDGQDDNKYTYTQPGYDVTVTLQFEKIKYTIAAPDNAQNGTVELAGVDIADDNSKSEGNNTASVGDTVKLSVTPDAGHALDTLTVTVDGQQQTITPTKNGDHYEFTMPAGNVTKIEGTFKEFVALADDNKPVIKRGGSAIGNAAPVVGDALIAETTATPVTWQWYADGQPIEGATTANYTVTKDVEGKAITVRATQAKDAGGTGIPTDDVTKSSDATGKVEKKTPAAMDADTAKGKITVSYPDETVTPMDGYDVSTDGTNPATSSPVSLTDVLDGSGTPTIYVRTAETDDTKAGDWVAVTLEARPDTPVLTTENATDVNTADGKINGTTVAMEYSPDNGATWTVASATPTLVKPGTYLVRVKATNDAPTGKTVEVQVGSKEIILTDAQKPTVNGGLYYTGSAQDLMTAPKEALPEGAKEIRYAIGTDATTAPTSGWGTSIPTATDAGT